LPFTTLVEREPLNEEKPRDSGELRVDTFGEARRSGGDAARVSAFEFSRFDWNRKETGI